MDIENCDEMIKACEVGMAVIRELDEYRKIGTLDECRTAREKMIPMELHHTRMNKEPVKTRDSVCPSCLGVIRTALNEFPNYCSNCGQALKWGD